jgi:hypothetical protein
MLRWRGTRCHTCSLSRRQLNTCASVAAWPTRSPQRWLATEGTEGLLVIKLLVPRTMLRKLLDGELQFPGPTIPPPTTHSTRTRSSTSSSQLRLLDGDGA